MCGEASSTSFKRCIEAAAYTKQQSAITIIRVEARVLMVIAEQVFIGLDCRSNLCVLFPHNFWKMSPMRCTRYCFADIPQIFFCTRYWFCRRSSEIFYGKGIQLQHALAQLQIHCQLHLWQYQLEGKKSSSGTRALQLRRAQATQLGALYRHVYIP